MCAGSTRHRRGDGAPNGSPETEAAYHHGDLRDALIQAGLELLAEGGAEALDLRKVARRAGVSHAAPYRHFADKQALMAAINEEGFDGWLNGFKRRCATRPMSRLSSCSVSRAPMSALRRRIPG